MLNQAEITQPPNHENGAERLDLIVLATESAPDPTDETLQDDDVDFWRGIDVEEPDFRQGMHYEWAAETLEHFQGRPLTTTDLAKIVYGPKFSQLRLINMQVRMNQSILKSPSLVPILDEKGLELKIEGGRQKKYGVVSKATGDEIDLESPPTDEELREIAVAVRLRELTRQPEQPEPQVPRKKKLGRTALTGKITDPDASVEETTAIPAERNSKREIAGYVSSVLRKSAPIEIKLVNETVEKEVNQIVEELAQGQRISGGELSAAMQAYGAISPPHLIRKVIKANHGVLPYRESSGNPTLSRDQLQALQYLSFGAHTRHLWELMTDNTQVLNVKRKQSPKDLVRGVLEMFNAQTEAEAVYKGFVTGWLGSEDERFVDQAEFAVGKEIVRQSRPKEENL